jgi:hypothetical protein
MTKLHVRARRAKSSAPARPSSSSSSPSSPPSSPPILPPEDAFRALAALGFAVPIRIPTPETPVQDLLLYALTYRNGPRPDLDMVLVVAAELEALSMFVEGPLHVTLGTLARRLRAAVDLSNRLAATAPAQEAA